LARTGHLGAIAARQGKLPPARVTHFIEELSFPSESDKDWVMGRAILARLKWA